MCEQIRSGGVLNRRNLLHSGLALGASFAATRVSGRVAQKTDARLVVVLLRGAVDGLSVVVPYSDTNYYSLRPNIAIAAPDGTDKTVIKLNDRFGIHPSLAGLMPMWTNGSLAFVAAAGLPKPNRSHFDAQYQVEIASSGKSSGAEGWLNSLAQTADGRQSAALGVGEMNPAILAGRASTKLIPRGQAAARTGVLANEKTRAALLDLYQGQGAIGDAFAKGAGSRMQSAAELVADKSAMQQGMGREMQAANNGAADPVGLALDAQHLATLMGNDANLRLGFLSAGGWDTHANQGNVQGQLANNLGNLANGLLSLRKQFNRPNDTVLVLSEFGRTAAENGTRGTDHGFGNAIWLMGERINGGAVHGEFSGLGRGDLNEARDLPAHHDYRSVLAQVLKRQFSLTDTQLANVLPGANWDARLDRLLKA